MISYIIGNYSAVRNKFEVKTVGDSIHQEYWIPVEELSEFNRNIVGLIEVIAEYRGDTEAGT